MVIDGIAAGQKAAAAIDATLRAAKGEEPTVVPEVAIDIPFEVDEENVETPQMPMPELREGAEDRFPRVELGTPWSRLWRGPSLHALRREREVTAADPGTRRDRHGESDDRRQKVQVPQAPRSWTRPSRSRGGPHPLRDAGDPPHPGRVPVCVVEVERARNLVAACVYPVAEG